MIGASERRHEVRGQRRCGATAGHEGTLAVLADLLHQSILETCPSDHRSREKVPETSLAFASVAGDERSPFHLEIPMNECG